MRRFLSTDNLLRAAVLGSVATLLAVPRILQGGMPLAIHGPAAFAVLTLSAGMVTAWGGTAGMCGAFPGRRRQCWGIAIALLGSLLMLPLHVIWIDPMVHAAIATADDPRLMVLTYPETLGGILASMLWCASFQTLCFHTAPVSFFARLSGRSWMGILGVGMFRLLASQQHLAVFGIESHSAVLVGIPVVGAMFAGYLFSRTGLVPTATFSAGLNLHLFWVAFP